MDENRVAESQEKVCQKSSIRSICNDAVDALFMERSPAREKKEIFMFSISGQAKYTSIFSRWFEKLTTSMQPCNCEDSECEGEKIVPMSISEACAMILANPTLRKKINDCKHITFKIRPSSVRQAFIH